MIANSTQQLNQLLENIAIALDITEAQYNKAVERYTAVSNHLAKEDSILQSFQPDIKPQGSFLLGTMIRPIIETDELDVDLVCRLKGKNKDWAQINVKNVVGDQIRTNPDYERMLDKEGKRCWTIIYSGDFHMDILPALVGQEHYELFEKSYAGLSNDQVKKLSIRITDRTLGNYRWDSNALNWPKSNPFGYAKWFKNKASMSISKGILLRENVEPLPSYTKDKEPLLRIVQILKRHRDIMFGKDEDKPISIIITTLAAKAYNKESNIVDGLLSVLRDMERYIEDRYSEEHGEIVKWIENPINEEENFADKWPNEPDKQQKFFDWLEKAKGDFVGLRSMSVSEAYNYLKEIIGTRSVNEAIKEIGLDNIITERYKPVNYNAGLLTVPHRQHPLWPLYTQYSCQIHAHYKDVKDKKRKTITASTVVPKGCYIYFTATTDVPKPFDVFWQIVNTGGEATKNNCLRGNIFKAQGLGAGGLKYKDASAFTGLHWAECFIVKGGKCVARSSEFFVNIQ